jgi:hypothetical protein
MKTLGILFGICLFALPAWADEFSKGDQVRLVQDTPLYFKESTVMRTGKSGERFTVIVSDAKSRRVYVSARGVGGKEIALNIAAEALELVQPPQPDVLPAVNIPAVMGMRFGATNRSRALLENGGKPESEEAVIRGLQYLVKTQNPEGSWGKGLKPYVAAMTGFSVLSFLGHGETPDSPQFGAAVKSAVHWIVEQGQQSDGRLSMEPAFSQAGVYAHAIATFGLAEYYSVTRDPAVVDLLTKAVAYIVDGQGPDGGWMYAYDKSESDTSVSGWQIQALRAAHLSGLNLAGVDTALDKAMLNLKRVQGPKGGFGYRRSEDKYSLTGVGVLCTYIWKQEKDKTVREGIQFIMDETRKNYPVDYRSDRANLYAWYYNTQACLMVGGTAWSTWNRMFQDQILKAQSPDGSWPVLAKVGGGDLQADPEGVGPFYRTNLCILMLEVYYRYTSIVNK